MNKDYYENLTVGELRKRHFELGGAPGNKKKADLIDEILRMESGELLPTRSARGRKPLSEARSREDTIDDISNVIHAVAGSDSPLDEDYALYGIVEIMPEGYGYIRSKNYTASNKDAIVPKSVIDKFKLKTGDSVGVMVHKPVAKNVETVYDVFLLNNSSTPERQNFVNFEDLTAYYPVEKINLSASGEKFARAIDVISPIGKGQRVLVSYSANYDKTALLKSMVEAVNDSKVNARNSVFMVCANPEDVTDIKCTFTDELIVAEFDDVPKNQIHVAELLLERFKRLVEDGRDVILFCDSFTNFFYAYVNNFMTSYGDTRENAVDEAIVSLKRFFGSARKTHNGSFTVIAFASTNFSSEDEKRAYNAIYPMANCRIFTCGNANGVLKGIDFAQSSTNRFEHLLTDDEQLLHDKAVNLFKETPCASAVFDKMLDGTRNVSELLLKFEKFVKKYDNAD